MYNTVSPQQQQQQQQELRQANVVNESLPCSALQHTTSIDGCTHACLVGILDCLSSAWKDCQKCLIKQRSDISSPALVQGRLYQLFRLCSQHRGHPHPPQAGHLMYSRPFRQVESSVPSSPGPHCSRLLNSSLAICTVTMSSNL